MSKTILEQLMEANNFWISYRAKKHDNKLIKRFGTWTKPDTNIKGKHIHIKGNDIFVYWDHNAEPSAKGNKWRKATNPLKVEADFKNSNE